MWILALETTSAHGSVALLEDDRVCHEQPLPPRAYSTELFPALEALLRAGGLELSGIDLFAVADGPGSFTGVRVGLTAVKGLVEALGKPAAAVSTLRAVAAGSAPSTTGVVAALDASRGEVYLGVYPQGAAGGAEDESLLSVEAAGRRMAERPGFPVFTPEAELRERCVETWRRLAIAAPDPRLIPERLAGAVGRLGRRKFLAGGAIDALRLDARYIRRSDAEIFAHPRLD